MSLAPNVFSGTGVADVKLIDANFAAQAFIKAYGRSVGAVAAIASLATFTPAADGSFVVSTNVLVTTATNHNFAVTVTYTDEGGTSRTLILLFILVGGTATSNILNANGAVPYHGASLRIRAKGGTAITVATSGTFTSVVYNAETSITQDQ